MPHPQDVTWRPDPPQGSRNDGKEATGPDGQGGQRTDAPREKRDEAERREREGEAGTR
jgi:hypothetical protein